MLPTPTGAFSTCSGDVDSHLVKFVCSGTITAAGTFTATSLDTNNQTATYVGEADATTASGTFSVTNGVTGTFSCTH